MFDIPVGKALVPVETEIPVCFDDCYLWNINGHYKNCKGAFACCCSERKDGKNVVFKLVDYPAKENEKENGDKCKEAEQ